MTLSSLCFMKRSGGTRVCIGFRFDTWLGKPWFLNVSAQVSLPLCRTPVRSIFGYRTDTMRARLVCNDAFTRFCDLRGIFAGYQTCFIVVMRCLILYLAGRFSAFQPPVFITRVSAMYFSLQHSNHFFSFLSFRHFFFIRMTAAP